MKREADNLPSEHQPSICSATRTGKKLTKLYLLYSFCLELLSILIPLLSRMNLELHQKEITDQPLYSSCGGGQSLRRATEEDYFSTIFNYDVNTEAPTSCRSFRLLEEATDDSRTKEFCGTYSLFNLETMEVDVAFVKTLKSPIPFTLLFILILLSNLLTWQE